MKKRAAKVEKIDGINSEDLKRIHRAVRQVWQWSHPWKLAKKRARGQDGFDYCENPECPNRGKPVPKVFVDHIDPVGEVGGPEYIQRMFVSSEHLQCLCKKCHDAKTREER
jgi:hypothetical protein